MIVSPDMMPRPLPPKEPPPPPHEKGPKEVTPRKISAVDREADLGQVGRAVAIQKAGEIENEAMSGLSKMSAKDQERALAEFAKKNPGKAKLMAAKQLLERDFTKVPGAEDLSAGAPVMVTLGDGDWQVLRVVGGDETNFTCTIISKDGTTDVNRTVSRAQLVDGQLNAEWDNGVSDLFAGTEHKLLESHLAVVDGKKKSGDKKRTVEGKGREALINDPSLDSSILEVARANGLFTDETIAEFGKNAGIDVTNIVNKGGQIKTADQIIQAFNQSGIDYNKHFNDSIETAGKAEVFELNMIAGAGDNVQTRELHQKRLAEAQSKQAVLREVQADLASSDESIRGYFSRLQNGQLNASQARRVEGLFRRANVDELVDYTSEIDAKVNTNVKQTEDDKRKKAQKKQVLKVAGIAGLLVAAGGALVVTSSRKDGQQG